MFRLYHVPLLPLLASLHYQGVIFLVGSLSVSLSVLGDERFLYKLVQLVQQDIGEHWTHHASYNVAKKVVEFEYQEEIPRHRLRAAYGDGFKGAPLRCQSSGEGMFPQDAGMCDGKVPQALSQEDKRIGDSCHV